MGNFFTKKCKCQCGDSCNTQTPQSQHKQTPLQLPPQSNTQSADTTQLLLEINELKKQNECLKSLNDRQTNISLNILKNAMSHSNKSHLSTEEIDSKKSKKLQNDKLKHVSIDAIERYVEGMIADSDVNITYLPDFVERQLYKNILKMVLGLLDNILSNSHVTVFNHEINFELVPLNNFDEKSDNKSDDKNDIKSE